MIVMKLWPRITFKTVQEFPTVSLAGFKLPNFSTVSGAPVAGQPEAAPFGPCCSCSFYWPRDAFLKFSQS